MNFDEALSAITNVCHTPEQVAEFLAARRCGGVRGNPGKCPLAVYFKRSTDAEYTHVSAVIRIYPEIFEAPVIEIVTPDLLLDFTKQFDADGYPDLVQEAWRPARA